MLTYTLEQNAGVPLYEQLYRHIRADIQTGVLKRDEKLPSKRSLASHLAISVITVENAYAQLQTEGYVYTKPKSGFYVSDLEDVWHDPSESIQKQGLSVQTEQKSDFSGRKVPDMAGSSGGWFADFASNQTSSEDFPFVTWARLNRRVLLENREELLTNPPPGGCLCLREAIASYLASFRALHVDPSQILIGAGTEYLYGLLIQLLGPDKTYANEKPGYRKVTQIFQAHGVNSTGILLDEYGISIASLREENADVVHVTPSHHFPTGITMPAGRRASLLGWAYEKEGRYIIEDDYDSELRVDGKPLPPLAAMDFRGRVIYMNTFTKSLASTIRISYMVLPRMLVEAFQEKLGFYSCTVSTFEQFTLAAFIREGYFEKHVNRMRNKSRKKRDLLLSCLKKSKLGPYASILEEKAGLHFLLNIAMEEDGREFVRKAAANGIRLMSLEEYLSGMEKAEEGKLFHLNKVGDGNRAHTFVMNYSSVPGDRIEEAVRRMADLL